MATRKSATKATATAPESDLTFQNFLTELLPIIEKYSNTVGIGSGLSEFEKDEEEVPAEKPQPARRGRAAKAAPAPEPEDVDDDEEAEEEGSDALTEAELKKMSIAALRKHVASLDIFDDESIKAASKAELVEAVLEEQAGSDEEADTEEAEEEAEDAEADDREELEGKSLAELRKLARDEYGAEASELKGLDKDAIIDLILDADTDDDSDDDSEAAEDDGYTEDELEEMDTDDLVEIAEEWELTLPKRKTKAALVKLIFNAQFEDGDE